MKAFQWLGIGALVYFLFNRGASVVQQALTLSEATASNQRFSLTGFSMDVDLEIRNDNNFAVSLNAITGDIFFGRADLASLDFTGPIDIPAKSSAVVSGVAQAGFLNLAANVQDAVTNGAQLSNLSYRGVMNVGGVNLPFSKSLIQIG